MADDTRLREEALEESPVPCILVDASGLLLFANERARALFGVNTGHLGRPLAALEMPCPPADLGKLIAQALAEHRTVTQAGVERRLAEDEIQYLEVMVAPLYADRRQPLGAAVSFLDVTRIARLQDQLRLLQKEFQSITGELQSSNQELQSTNDELRSSNEELDAKNRELQAINDDLSPRS